MFTFSFGSAMAATEYDYDQAYKMLQDTADQYIADANSIMMGQLAAVDAAGVTVTDGASATLDVSKDAVKVVFQDKHDELVKAIKKNIQIVLTDFAGMSDEDKKNYSEEETTILALLDRTNDVEDVNSPTVADYTNLLTAGDANFKALAKAEFDIVKADTIKGLQAIDLSVYSTKKTAEQAKSDYDTAAAIVAAAVGLVNGYSYDDATSAADLEAMVDNMNAIYVAPEGKDGVYGGLIKTAATDNSTANLTAVGGAAAVALKGLYGLTELDAPATEEAKLSYAKIKTLAAVISALAAEKDSAVDTLQAEIMKESKKGAKGDAKLIADNTADIASINALYNDAVEVITYIINNAEAVGELGGFAPDTMVYTSGWTVTDANPTTLALFKNVTVKATTATDIDDPTTAMTVAELANRAALVDEAEAKAAYLKSQILIDGAEYANLDKALEDSIDDIYRGYGATLQYYTTTRVECALYHYVEDTLINAGAGANDVVALNGKKYEPISRWLAANVYDAANQDVVEAIVKEAKAAVRAAKTQEEADAAFLAAYEKYDAVLTETEHKADFLFTSGANHAKYEQVKAELAAHAQAKITLLTRLGELKNYGTDDLATLVNEYNGATGKFYTKCFTAEELDAKLAEAKAVIDGLKTEKVLAEEAAAIEKEINALPTTAKLADKEAVMAVYDKFVAHNDYCTLVDSLEGLSNAKIVRLAKEVKAAEIEAIEDASAAIAKDGKVTLDEKAAVEALRAAYDAYDAYWIESGDYDDVDGDLDINKLTASKVGEEYTGKVTAGANGINDVEEYEGIIDLLEAKAVIEAIGKLPADGSDVAGAKAARDAFNALSRDAKDYVYHTSAYSKLVDNEKVIAESVKALKLTASSKATKGAITVKWTVKGNTSSADGFQVWKSTKMNSGYKKAFTTTKTSYKNTKGLKKGVKYYYKVRAYKVVDGKNVYSDWSNKAYRVAK